MPDEQKPQLTLDQRLEFLHQSTESLHDSCQQLHASVTRLAELSDRNEKRWNKLNRAIYAAALEYFKPEDGDGNGAAS